MRQIAIAPGSTITKREQEVLELLGAGMTNKEIATKLELAARTVETHVERLLSKLGATSRTRAVIEARRLGLLCEAAIGEAASSPAGPPNNLRLPTTRLVGRTRDLVEVAQLLRAHRLVTLAGSGGAGKTRLALATAAQLIDDYPQGVWFADLSISSDAKSLARAVAKVLGVQAHPNQPVADTIVRALRRRRALVVFDSCEHVAKAAAELADDILHCCSEVRILATSREPLGVIGEIVYRIRSLDFPNNTTALTADSAMSFGAVELFVDRARASGNGFRLTNDNAATIGKICHYLDGIPLAIELAAARTNALSIESLARNLAEHFHLLAGGRRSALPRHQTMRALIDWSYDHLSAAEQTLFRRLSIFAGSFSFELVSAVCSDADIKEIEVLDLVASLIDKSLVQTAFGDAERYRLLETTRQYAREKLDRAGEYDALARRHCKAMVELAARLDATSESTPNAIWYALAYPELENWWAALEWALRGRGDLELGQRLAASLDGVWQWYAEVEGLNWVRTAMESVDAATAQGVCARLELANAKLGGNTGLACYAESLASADHALAYYTETSDPVRFVRAQHYKGRALVYMRRFAEGEAVLQEAIRAARALGLYKCAGGTLETLGLARLFQSDTSGACEFWTDGLSLLRRSGARDAECVPFTIHLAEAKFHDGKLDEALRLAMHATAAYRTMNYRQGLWYALMNAAAYLVRMGRFDEARTHAREALALTREFGMDLGTAVTLQHLAAIAALRSGDGSDARDDRIRAAQLFGFVESRLGELKYTREYTEQQEYDAAFHALRDQLGIDKLSGLMDAGRALNEDESVAQALLV